MAPHARRLGRRTAAAKNLLIYLLKHRSPKVRQPVTAFCAAESAPPRAACGKNAGSRHNRRPYSRREFSVRRRASPDRPYRAHRSPADGIAADPDIDPLAVGRSRPFQIAVIQFVDELPGNRDDANRADGRRRSPPRRPARRAPPRTKRHRPRTPHAPRLYPNRTFRRPSYHCRSCPPSPAAGSSSSASSPSVSSNNRREGRFAVGSPNRRSRSPVRTMLLLPVWSRL